MALLDLLKRIFRFHPRDPSYWAQKFWGGVESLTGVKVNEETAMKFSAYYAGVRIISETIASLPLNVYRRLPGGGKEKDTDHHLYYLLHNQPNRDMSSFIWREVVKAHILLWGNHYSLTPRNGMGRVQEIYPLLPWKVQPEKVQTSEGKIKIYHYYPDEGPIINLGPDEVLHIPGLSFDGLVGKSPLGWYREQIGLGLAMEEYSARFFSGGMHAGGVFTTPQALKEETYQRLKKELKAKYAGLSKAHETMILEQELKFDKISIDPNDAQLLESKKFQIEEIARILRVPLHLLQNLDKATFNNIEELGMSFVIYCIRPWLVRDEQAFNMQLLPTYEKKTHFIEHVVEGLLRGDIKTRYEAYAKGRQHGWLSADDIRELENMNPLPEGQGKIYLAPLNMIPLSQIVSLGNVRTIKYDGYEITIAPEKKSIELSKTKAIESVNIRSAQIRHRLSQSYKPLIENIATRIIKRETKDILKEAKKIFKERNRIAFYQYLDDYYEKHKDFIKTHSKPVFVDMGKAIAEEAAAETDYEIGSNDNLDGFLDSFNYTYTVRHARENKDRIIEIVEKGFEKGFKPAEILEVEFENWEENKPQQIADKQSIKIAGGVSLIIYGAAGVTELVWRNTSGKPCPFCQSLDGTVVGISQPFFIAGQEFMPEGAESKLIFGGDIRHGPLHDGCQCQISPA